MTNHPHAQFELPIQQGRDADASDGQVARSLAAMNELMELCNKFMLRRTSTVLKALLPAKVEQVVFCKLSPLQLRLSNFFLAIKPVQQLLASTAPQQAGGGSGRGGRGGRGGRAASGRGGGGAAAAASGGGAASGKAPRESQLAPLAAITALKNLCCHPDLVYDLAAAAAGVPRRAGGPGAFAAPQRVSARAGAGAAGQQQGAAADGAAADGAASGRGSGAAAASGKGGGDNGGGGQLTGFEGCLPVFQHPETYPAYRPGEAQAFHSGKVMVLQSLLKAIRTSQPTDKVVLVSNYTQVGRAVGRLVRRLLALIDLQ
jgi:SNF2 family DNA or RNA helicase